MTTITATSIAAESFSMLTMTMLAPAKDATTKHGDNATITALQIATRNKVVDAIDITDKEDIVKHEFFQADFRLGLGGFVMNTKETFTGFLVSQGTIIEFTSPSSGVNYKLRCEKYDGSSVLKAKDPKKYTWAEVTFPPTSTTTDDVDTKRSAIINAFTRPGLKATPEPKKDMLKNPKPNEWHVPFDIMPPGTQYDPQNVGDVKHKLYLALKVELPSGNVGKTLFSKELCNVLNIHRDCGKVNNGVVPCECSWNKSRGMKRGSASDFLAAFNKVQKK